jgi:hypothetical protein
MAVTDRNRRPDSRGVIIRQNVSRGNVRVSGIEFPVTHDKADEAIDANPASRAVT